VEHLDEAVAAVDVACSRARSPGVGTKGRLFDTLRAGAPRLPLRRGSPAGAAILFFTRRLSRLARFCIAVIASTPSGWRASWIAPIPNNAL
jgi:hypothetical protein